MGYIFFYQFGLGPIPYFIGAGKLSRDSIVFAHSNSSINRYWASCSCFEEVILQLRRNWNRIGFNGCPAHI